MSSFSHVFVSSLQILEYTNTIYFVQNGKKTAKRNENSEIKLHYFPALNIKKKCIFKFIRFYKAYVQNVVIDYISS